MYPVKSLYTAFERFFFCALATVARAMEMAGLKCAPEIGPAMCAEPPTARPESVLGLRISLG
jgi:hypothetical protein